MRTLLTNIFQLCSVYSENPPLRCQGEDMKTLPVLDNAWLLIEDGTVVDFGKMKTLPECQTDVEIDASDRLVLPAWVDSHTHLVFAGSREQEFVDRINGLSYEEIARRGGGILNSAERLRKTSEDDLFESAQKRLNQLMAQGTGAIEIKSGYGLDTENELKMLRVIRRLKEQNSIVIKSNFLAAHAYPKEFLQNKKGYVDLIINTMLPKVVTEGLADYIDVFCEQGFFSVEDTARILEAGLKHGLKAKIHANQLYHSGGVEVGVAHQAVSVDHLECVGEKEIQALKNSTTIPTLLPGAAFFLGINYQPARAMIDANLPVCLATDYNPGSCPSGNMNLLLTLACTQLKMTPAEAINSITVNGAAALEISEQTGCIAKGKKGPFILTKK